MVNRRSKKHHHVPETLQKRFLNSIGHIWYAERKSLRDPFTAPDDRNPTSCFRSRNFYTVLEGVDGKSDKVERDFYGPVDNHLGRLLDEIDTALAQNKLPVFKNDRLTSLDNLMIALFKRSFDTATIAGELDAGIEVRDKIHQRINQEISVSEAPVIKAKVPDAKDLGRHVRVMAQIAESPKLRHALRDYEVSFVIPEGRGSFVLGSKMIYRTGNGGSETLGSENVELWFPISSKYCLVRHHRNLRPAAMHIWPDYRVHQINSSIVSQSLGVAASSKFLLDDLLRS